MNYYITLPTDQDQRNLAIGIVHQNGGEFRGCSDFADPDGPLQIEGMTHFMKAGLEDLGLVVSESEPEPSLSSQNYVLMPC